MHLQFSMLWFLPFPESDDSNLTAGASPTSTPSFRRLSATTDGRIVGDETPDMTQPVYSLQSKQTAGHVILHQAGLKQNSWMPLLVCSKTTVSDSLLWSHSPLFDQFSLLLSSSSVDWSSENLWKWTTHLVLLIPKHAQNNRFIWFKPHDKAHVQRYVVSDSANKDRFNFIGE